MSGPGEDNQKSRVVAEACSCDVSMHSVVTGAHTGSLSVGWAVVSGSKLVIM